MAGFIPYQYPHDVDPMAYYEFASGLNVKPGDALYINGGKLALATGTQKPAFISNVRVVSTVAGVKYPVQPVMPGTIYETELAEASESIAVGAKYTIAATADGITATTTNGVAEVVAYDGKTAGSRVLVKFA